MRWLLIFLATSLHAEDWAQWGRDASRNTVAQDKGLPETFLPGKILENNEVALTKDLKWAARLNLESYGNVTVSGGKVFIGINGPSPYDPKYTSPGGGVLLCLEESSGKFLWQLVVPKLKAVSTKFTADQWSVGICSSPTVVGNRVYVTSNRGEILCLDVDGLANGNDGPFQNESQYVVGPDSPPIESGATDADIVWCYDMIKELGVWPHDASNCSPLVLGDYVYAGTSNGTDSSHRYIPAPKAPTFIALDKVSGKLAAIDDSDISPRVFNGQWSSPSAALIDGKSSIFYGGGDGFCYAFEPLDSPREQPSKLKELWRVNCNPESYRAEDLKNNSLGSRRRAQGEIISTPVVSGNLVYVAIGQDPRHGLGKGALTCIDPKMGRPVWSYEKIGRSVSSPSIADGLLYIGDTSGAFHCVDAKTGECYWTHEAKGPIWGSALVADGKVYFGDMAGNLTILRAGKERNVLSEIKFNAPICSTPIVANGVLYIAAHTHLYAVRPGRATTGGFAE